MRQDFKEFDENCLYITEDECRLKHYLSVHFLREYFASQALNADEYIQKVYERIELSNALGDYMIYIEVEQSHARDLIAALDEDAPCFILLKKGHQYEPEAYYFIFYTTNNIKRINEYLNRFGFYEVDTSGYFGGTPDEDAPKQGESKSETESNAFDMLDIPPNNEDAPTDANSIYNQAAIEQALHSGVLTLPNNIYTLPKSVLEQIKINNLATTKVVMTEIEWKKHGYTVTNDTDKLYLKNVPNAPEYLPLYNQSHVNRTEEHTPLRETDRNAILQRSIIELQQLIRNNAIMRDKIIRENVPQYGHENTVNRTMQELSGMIFSLIPAAVLINSGEIQQQISQYQSLAENSVKRVLLNALSPVLGAENAEPIQAVTPDEKTLASDITKAAIPIPAFLTVISNATQCIAGTIQNAISNQREETMTIARATVALEGIPDEIQEKIPLLNADNYRGKDNVITLTFAVAKEILQAFTAYQKGLQAEVTR